MLVNNRRAYVLNDMGTGKTRAALWAWDYLNQAGYANKLLVVCPLSTAHQTWGREIFQTFPHRKVVVLHAASRAQRLKRLEEDADIYVINHDGVDVIAKELMQHQGIDTLVLDELAVYRNGQTQRNKTMRMFAASMKYVWGMTGTPLPNGPTDVWGQCRIITPNSIPKFFSHFRDRVMRKQGQWQWVPREDAVETAYRCMQPSVRYALDDVVELPPVIERYVDIPLTPEQAAAYREVKTVAQTLVRQKKITAVNAAVAMTKLLQVSAGWVYAEGQESVQLDAGNRVNMLLELLSECKRKVIVFASFKHIVHGLADIFTQEKIGHVVIHGGISGRENLFNAFRSNPAVKVLLAQPKCMSHGLTLTEADTIIWYCPIASNETYQQADARIRRVGQKHKQQIIHLQSTPVERRVYSLLRSKQATQEEFLKLFLENGNGHHH